LPATLPSSCANSRNSPPHALEAWLTVAETTATHPLDTTLNQILTA
jgi:hypothetical protein